MIYSTDQVVEVMASAKRELFKSPDVCEMAQLQPYVLRSWEAEFPGLGKPADAGGRIYRRADVEMVLRIKQLVFVEGLTLAGARRQLDEDRADGQPELSVAAGAIDDALGDMARARLREVRTGLEAIMGLLSRDAGQPPDLQLVPPPSSTVRTARPRVASKRSMAAARGSSASTAKSKSTPGKRRRAG